MKDRDLNDEIHEANRRSWNAATVAHNSHKRDQAKFLRDGGSTLFQDEIDLLGDVDGLNVLHLQCNAGQDSLSIAQLGATVTGVDFSDEAIAFAQKLSEDSGIDATFQRADVYDWLPACYRRGDRYDVAFCSYGSVCWLSDLDKWAKGVASILASGGRFIAIDFHPASMMFNERFELSYSYFGEGEPQRWEEGVGDYVAMSGADLTPSGFQEGIKAFQNPHPVYEFQWHIGAVLTSLLRAHLVIEKFREYPYLNGGHLFNSMREEAGRRLLPPEGVPSVPLMYSFVARKPS